MNAALRTAAILSAVMFAALAGFSARPWPVQAQGIDFSHGGPVQVTAKGGIEWLQQQHEVIASGGATAKRQDVTVTAARLIAFYRKKATPGAPAGSAKPPPPPRTQAVPAGDITGEDGGNEIYRLVAEGRVVITTPTDRAVGDHAVYDLDQAVLVLTGHDVRLTTPNEVLTARDDLEYWSARHMAVARGDAVVVTKDHRRLSADVLVAYTKPDNQTAAKPTPASTTRPAGRRGQGSGQAGGGQDTLENSGKLEKVEAFGHVVVSTPNEVVTGDRGVYSPDSGIALLFGAVRITRGPNELEGSEAEVNMKTGVSRLIGGRSSRVVGLIVPESAAPPTNRTASAPARRAAP